MHRREFIGKAVLVSPALYGLGWANPVSGDPVGQVMTVTGPIKPSMLGFTLTHEHVLVEFAGADLIDESSYDHELILQRVLPYFKELKSYGVKTFVDCTPAYIGRVPGLLRKISHATGMQILTNTGFYGARMGEAVPTLAKELSPERLAEIWIDEARNGIRDTGVFPGFIKIGVNGGPLSKLDQKLIRAAAICHRETGLAIHSHTGGSPEAGNGQLAILKEEGVSAGAWTWVHAQGMGDLEQLRPAFEQGAWISFDNLRPEEKSVERIIRCLTFAMKNGWENQVLLSHDAGWYDPSIENGGPHRPYTAYFTHLLEAAGKGGIDRAALDRISVRNPAENFLIRKRTL